MVGRPVHTEAAKLGWNFPELHVDSGEVPDSVTTSLTVHRV